MTDPIFVDGLLKLLAEYDARDSLWWSVAPSGEIRFSVLVSDDFWWGTADLEQITPENLADLRSACRDAAAAIQHGGIHGDTLFAARIRTMRPQGAVYERLPRELWPLFDACGPEREVDVCNPKAQPTEAKP